MKVMPSDKRQCENLKIMETYDENWRRRCRETGKNKEMEDFIVGVRPMIEISGAENTRRIRKKIGIEEAEKRPRGILGM